jgi:predicted AAA+ superfamily ATPase
MNTIERPHRDVLNKALDIYRDAMRPFIVNSLRRVRGRTLEEVLYDSLPRQAHEFQERLGANGGNVEAVIDITHFPALVSKNWRGEVFGRQFGGDMTVQNLLYLITQARNHVMHPSTEDLESEYVRVSLFHISDVLGRINAAEAKAEVEKLRDEHFGPQQPALPIPDPPPETENISQRTPRAIQGNLKPWREVIPPNLELTQGTFEEAELAANLQQVYDGRASATSYGNPVSFFKQTHLTAGLRSLLTNALQRLAGKGGAPVIQTKTGFGGGKTHSLIALYHLANSIDALAKLPADGDSANTHADIHAIMQAAGWDSTRNIHPKVAVLEGTFLSPTDAEATKENGDPLNTLWGVMAYQLGGQIAYDLIGTAARRQDSAPLGAQLDKLFDHIGPCVILMDELVAYMVNLSDDLLGVNYTFVQALTESARRAKNVVIVATLPESRREAGGQKGETILATLETRLGRIESIWKPLETNEAFEVVRRRLFGNQINETERDRTCETFVAMYNRNRGAFPEGVHEQRYLTRMKACYPIHPEIFERLHSDWSTIHEFQRTRGVLRLMANCISRLYRTDTSPLIMPGNLPLDDPDFTSEFDKILSGRWDAVFTEADSNGGRADLIDQRRSSFSEYGGAARRIARTVFLGSCPSGAIRGIDTNRIHLGVAQPKQRITTYTEALTEMRGNLYYFYADDSRYYFHTEENLNKVAIDRANEISDSEIHGHIVSEVTEAARQHRSRLIICPQDLDTIPDKDELRLVILPPDKLLPSRSSETDEAIPAALHILKHRASGERTHRNTLLFLGSKTDDMRDLQSYTREHLAWKSITQGERRIQNLKDERLSQAQANLRKADETVRRIIPKAYRFAMAPTQLDPQHTEFTMSPEQTRAAESGDIVGSAFDTFKAREALIDYEAPEILNARLEEYIWNDNNHIAIQKIWEMMTQYVYMPRLENRDVLTAAIQEGVENGTFGYAERYDTEQQRYYGLQFRQQIHTLNPNGLIVKAETAGLKPKLSLESLTPTLRERVWDTAQAHIQVEEVWKMMPTHLDDADLKRETLVECIEQGVPQGQFGYAEGIAEDTSTYENLFFREAVPPDAVNFEGFLIDPQTAAAEKNTARLGATRIVARKIVEGELSLDAINDLRQEIIAPLDTDGGDVTIEITITAYKADGFSQNIERSVKENGIELDIEVKSDNK